MKAPFNGTMNIDIKGSTRKWDRKRMRTAKPDKRRREPDA
jgi:hypothetical protein